MSLPLLLGTMAPLGIGMRTYFIVLFLLFSHSLHSVIVLPSSPNQTAMDWDGIDDYDGSGSASFLSLGDSIQGTLRILCNKKQGYKVWLSSTNATSKTISYIVNGSYQIRYTASMDTSGIQNADIRTADLDLQGSMETLDVRFNRKSDVLPLDGNTEANVLIFTFDLDGPTGDLYPQGSYSDIITATIALN